MLYVTVIRMGELLDPDYPGETPRRDHTFCMRVSGSRDGEDLIRSSLGHVDLSADAGVTMGEIGCAMRDIDGPFVPAIKITSKDPEVLAVAFGPAHEVWAFARGMSLDTYKLKEEIEHQREVLGQPKI